MVMIIIIINNSIIVLPDLCYLVVEILPGRQQQIRTAANCYSPTERWNDWPHDCFNQ